MTRPLCFVLMPFGQKVDASGLTIDFDAIYRELSAKGVEFSGEPADQDWGARLVGLKVPDGNNLYFLKYL